MLATFIEVLQESRASGRALGSFTCYNFEIAQGVLDAATRRSVPVILLISEKSFASSHGKSLAAALVAMAAHADIPVCVELDHVDDIALIQAALDLGVGAIMADGSRLSFEANCDFVRSAVSLSERYGGHVEAELGRIEGNEEIAAAAAAGRLTDPRDVAMFVNRSGAACLAVSIGNVHGNYASPPHLDWARLDEIREAVEVPLSLHGASGLDAGDVQRAVRAGINKINVNTELRECYLDTLRGSLDDVLPGARVLDLGTTLTKAIAQIVDTKLGLFAGRTQDGEGVA